MSTSFSSGSNSDSQNLEDDEGISNNLGNALMLQVYCCHLNVDYSAILQYGTKLIAFLISTTLFIQSTVSILLLPISGMAFEIGEHLEVKHEFLIIQFQNGYVRFDWGQQGLNIRVSKFLQNLFRYNENARPKLNILRRWKVQFQYGISFSIILEMIQCLLAKKNHKYNALKFNCKHFSKRIFYLCKDIAI